ncbi:dachshund homolog 2 [Harpegnathos saltator]|uniref:dachshund homolog 2 n=1 Tax=Harpegnathos saltator TaxID=610380 RepID=UPI000DBEE3A0|nr:dachshund homolog 2 [Harpegnathos saltator]
MRGVDTLGTVKLRYLDFLLTLLALEKYFRISFHQLWNSSFLRWHFESLEEMLVPAVLAFRVAGTNAHASCAGTPSAKGQRMFEKLVFDRQLKDLPLSSSVTDWIHFSGAIHLRSVRRFERTRHEGGGQTSRPGRPPKRASVGLSLAASHLAAAAGHHPQHSLKKHRLDNGDYYENGHLDVPRMEKSPLLANGYNHPPTHLSHMQFMQLGGHPGAGHTAILSPASLPHHLQAQAQARAEQGLKVNPNMTNMEALARSGTVWENCRAAYEDIVKHLERLREERGDAERALALDHKPRDLSSHNGSSNGHSPVLNLSKTAGSGSVGEHSGSEAGASHRSQDDEEEDDNLSEDLEDDNEKDEDLSDVPENLPLPAPGSESPQALNYSQIASAAVAVSQGAQDPSVSSTETLLRNIQGLLKVAADNARQQERQINYEKAELKMDVLREREVKDSLERQLQDEQKVRGEYERACWFHLVVTSSRPGRRQSPGATAEPKASHGRLSSERRRGLPGRDARFPSVLAKKTVLV